MTTSAVKAFASRVARGDATVDEAKDTAMALVALLLIVWFARRKSAYITFALATQLVSMAAPQVFRPLAVLWFGLSHVMGAIASRVILSVVFFVVVTPVGWYRRMIGADSLKLTAFKAGTCSVMKVRNHLFTGQDLERPY